MALLQMVGEKKVSLEDTVDGMITDRGTGNSWDEEVRHRILEPLCS